MDTVRAVGDFRFCLEWNRWLVWVIEAVVCSLEDQVKFCLHFLIRALRIQKRMFLYLFCILETLIKK